MTVKAFKIKGVVTLQVRVNDVIYVDDQHEWLDEGIKRVAMNLVTERMASKKPDLDGLSIDELLPPSLDDPRVKEMVILEAQHLKLGRARASTRRSRMTAYKRRWRKDTRANRALVHKAEAAYHEACYNLATWPGAKRAWDLRRELGVRWLESTETGITNGLAHPSGWRLSRERILELAADYEMDRVLA